MAKQIRNYFELNYFFADEQLMLRGKRSCEHELMSIVDSTRLITKFSKRNYLSIIFACDQPHLLPTSYLIDLLLLHGLIKN